MGGAVVHSVRRFRGDVHGVAALVLCLGVLLLLPGAFFYTSTWAGWILALAAASTPWLALAWVLKRIQVVSAKSWTQSCRQARATNGLVVDGSLVVAGGECSVVSEAPAAAFGDGAAAVHRSVEVTECYSATGANGGSTRVQDPSVNL